MRYVLLVVALGGCAFAFQDRPGRAAKCSTGQGLAAIDGLAAVASFAFAGHAASLDGSPARVVAISTGVAGIIGFGASAVLGRGWAERCRLGA